MIEPSSSMKRQRVATVSVHVLDSLRERLRCIEISTQKELIDTIPARLASLQVLRERVRNKFSKAGNAQSIPSIPSSLGVTIKPLYDAGEVETLFPSSKYHQQQQAQHSRPTEKNFTSTVVESTAATVPHTAACRQPTITQVKILQVPRRGRGVQLVCCAVINNVTSEPFYDVNISLLPSHQSQQQFSEFSTVYASSTTGGLGLLCPGAVVVLTSLVHANQSGVVDYRQMSMILSWRETHASSDGLRHSLLVSLNEDIHEQSISSLVQWLHNTLGKPATATVDLSYSLCLFFNCVPLRIQFSEPSYYSSFIASNPLQHDAKPLPKVELLRRYLRLLEQEGSLSASIFLSGRRVDECTLCGLLLATDRLQTRHWITSLISTTGGSQVGGRVNMVVSENRSASRRYDDVLALLRALEAELQSLATLYRDVAVCKLEMARRSRGITTSVRTDGVLDGGSVVGDVHNQHSILLGPRLGMCVSPSAALPLLEQQMYLDLLLSASLDTMVVS